MASLHLAARRAARNAPALFPVPPTRCDHRRRSRWSARSSPLQRQSFVLPERLRRDGASHSVESVEGANLFRTRLLHRFARSRNENLRRRLAAFPLAPVHLRPSAGSDPSSSESGCCSIGGFDRCLPARSVSVRALRDGGGGVRAPVNYADAGVSGVSMRWNVRRSRCPAAWGSIDGEYAHLTPRRHDVCLRVSPRRSVHEVHRRYDPQVEGSFSRGLQVCTEPSPCDSDQPALTLPAAVTDRD